jgi:hypothetical protein
MGLLTPEGALSALGEEIVECCRDNYGINANESLANQAERKVVAKIIQHFPPAHLVQAATEALIAARKPFRTKQLLDYFVVKGVPLNLVRLGGIEHLIRVAQASLS